jgi:hypothetical protein
VAQNGPARTRTWDQRITGRRVRAQLARRCAVASSAFTGASTSRTVSAETAPFRPVTRLTTPAVWAKYASQRLWCDDDGRFPAVRVRRCRGVRADAFAREEQLRHGGAEDEAADVSEERAAAAVRLRLEDYGFASNSW